MIIKEILKMTKSKLVNQINHFYAALATEEPIYNNCYITKKDLESRDVISEILYDLKENTECHEAALPLYREVKHFIRKRHINIAELIFIALGICLMLWAGLSWIKVVCKNLNPNPPYSPINLFTILLSLF